MDFNKALVLLSVAEKAIGFPRLKALHDEALEELQEMADEAVKDAAAKAKQAVEAKAKLEAAAKAEEPEPEHEEVSRRI